MSIRQVVAAMNERGHRIPEKRWRGIEAEGTPKEGTYPFRPLSITEMRQFCDLTKGSPLFLVYGIEPAQVPAQGVTGQDDIRALMFDNLAVEIANDTRHMATVQRDALRAFWIVFVKPMARSPLVNFQDTTPPREAVRQYLKAVASMTDNETLATIKRIARVFGVDDSTIGR